MKPQTNNGGVLLGALFTVLVMSVGGWLYYSYMLTRSTSVEVVDDQKFNASSTTETKKQDLNQNIKVDAGAKTYTSNDLLLVDSGTTLMAYMNGMQVHAVSLDDVIKKWLDNVSSRQIDRFIVEDINFDGYLDFAMLTGYAMTVEEYDYYVFNSVVGKFERDPLLVSLPNPKFNAETRTITTLNYFSPRSVEQTYTFNGSTYVAGEEKRTCHNPDVCGDE